MRLLIDTHALVWLAAGDRRTSGAVLAVLGEANTVPFVSAVTAWEYTDLHLRGRFPSRAPLDAILGRFALSVIEFPAETWQRSSALPDIHRDPVDRMLVAHALVGGYTIVTADKTIHAYPVPTLW